MTSDMIRCGSPSRPKRPYRVAKLGGGHKTFASVTSAIAFAWSQANASLTSPNWSVKNTRTGRVATVHRNFEVEWAEASDRCRTCGSDNLFSGFFGADNLADDGRQPGSRWTTFCNDCGEEQ